MTAVRGIVSPKALMDRVRAALARSAPRRLAPRAGRAHATVAVVLRERKGDVELLLMERTPRSGDRWSGHLAFPGGVVQHGDASLLDALEREVREEVGLDLGADGRVLGPLGELFTLSHRGFGLMVITPFVVELLRDAPVVLGSEARSVAWLSLAELVRRRTHASRARRWLGWMWPRAGEPVGSAWLWGLTLRMVDELVDRVHREEVLERSR